MPDISQRGQAMPSSPIRKLAPLAAAAESRGVKIYKLNIGQPDIHTPQKALDALKNIDREVLEYSPSQGILSLREALVNYYRTGPFTRCAVRFTDFKGSFRQERRDKEFPYHGCRNERPHQACPLRSISQDRESLCYTEIVLSYLPGI